MHKFTAAKKSPNALEIAVEILGKNSSFPTRIFMQPTLDKKIAPQRVNIDKEILKGPGPKTAPKREQNQVPTKNWRASRFAGPARKSWYFGPQPGHDAQKEFRF